MSKPTIHKTDSLSHSPYTVAAMITGQITLGPADEGETFETVSKPRDGSTGAATATTREGDRVKAISKGVGTGGNPVGRVIDVLKNRDRPDARPPAVCKTCFEAWTHTGRPKLITCKHNSVAALRHAGRWSVATGLTRAQIEKLGARQ